MIKNLQERKIYFTQELIFLLPNVYEVLGQHQTIDAQSNEDDYKMVSYRLQQNRQQDDRRNYPSEPILIDVCVLYPLIIKKNKTRMKIFDFFYIGRFIDHRSLSFQCWSFIEKILKYTDLLIVNNSECIYFNRFFDNTGW